MAGAEPLKVDVLHESEDTRRAGRRLNLAEVDGRQWALGIGGKHHRIETNGKKS
jgi:hypothetical protein